MVASCAPSTGNLAPQARRVPWCRIQLPGWNPLVPRQVINSLSHTSQVRIAPFLSTFLSFLSSGLRMGVPHDSIFLISCSAFLPPVLLQTPSSPLPLLLFLPLLSLLNNNKYTEELVFLGEMCSKLYLMVKTIWITLMWSLCSPSWAKLFVIWKSRMNRTQSWLDHHNWFLVCFHLLDVLGTSGRKS